ncbi:MAG: N-6 DNA methylase [Blautia sp.]|nr:N-6 DNA methylase [Blautia sp.]
MASEEITKGIVAEKLAGIPEYPMRQNEEQSGIVWFKEDSYVGTRYNWLRDVFSKASKKQNLSEPGRPDFTIIKEKSNLMIVIECKAKADASGSKHSMFENPGEYCTYGYGTPYETIHYAVNGALYYATFLNSIYDVIAIGVSGQSKAELKITSFLLPKGGELSDLVLLEDAGYQEALSPLSVYEKKIDEVLGRFSASEEEIRNELKKYTLVCANFLRANGIEDNSKAGFISAVFLGLTNTESRLYAETKEAVGEQESGKTRKPFRDPIGKDAVKMLKAALYGDGESRYDTDYRRGVWDIDGIPEGKRRSLKFFYDALLGRDELLKAPKGQDNRYFKDGDTVLSCCIFSVYENVICILERCKGIDIMGEFYTTFLRFTKGNAKEKGIVLTPKHITDLFCDLAEYYSGEGFSENTRILDICCGTGAFLISALGRIKENIRTQFIGEDKKQEKYEKAQKKSLIGVERDASMYALAYANMRFHGDGKSNLFNCSSLLSDSYAPMDDSGMTYLSDGRKVHIHEALAEFGEIDIGMINPPYSLGTTANKRKAAYPDGTPEEVVIQKGQEELDFTASMLHYLKKGGIGIAILPMSCAGNSGEKMRRALLKHHTLLACMTMSPNLFFDSHVGTATCIMVWKAHVPHDESKAVFFARWQEDGFRVIPHNGRMETEDWANIRVQWLEQIDGIAPANDYVFMKRRILTGSEALAEAYVKTDYSRLSEMDFIGLLKKYALYKYMDARGYLEEPECTKLSWYLDHIDQKEFESMYAGAAEEQTLVLTDRAWGEFMLGDEQYFKIERGASVYLKNMALGDIPYVSTTQEKNGITQYVSESNREGNLITLAYDGSIGACFYQENAFFASEKIVTIDLVQQELNKYTAFFIIGILKLESMMYSYGGRKWTVEKQLKETAVRLPVAADGQPDYAFMELYIKSLPFSGNI